MQCLGCGHELAAAMRDGIGVESCAQCGGMWLGADALLRVVRANEASPEAGVPTQPPSMAGTSAIVADAASAPSRACPECAQPLERFTYDEASGVVIDSCFDHGTWLDAGELERIEAWTNGWHVALGAQQQLTPEEQVERTALDAANAHRHGPFGAVAASFSYWRDARDGAQDGVVGARRPGS